MPNNLFQFFVIAGIWNILIVSIEKDEERKKNAIWGYAVLIVISLAGHYWFGML